MIGFFNEEELLVKFPVCLSWEYYFNEEQWKPLTEVQKHFVIVSDKLSG